MKKIFLLFTAFISFLNFSYGQAGRLDSTFGTNGIVKSTVASFNSIAVQTDGKIIAGGAKVLVRYNTNGSLDNSFGKDGVKSTNFSISAIKVQKDSKILAAGDSTLARYSTDGSADNTFSGDGKQTTDFTISKIAIANDGKIVVAHNQGNVLGGSFVARYNSDGSPDNSFDSDGKATVPFYLLSDITLQNDGKIVVVGSLHAQVGFSLARFNTNGSPDNTFGKDGIQTPTFNSYQTSEILYYPSSVAIQSDGKIVVGGLEENSFYDPPYSYSYDQPVLARYNTDGSLDSSLAGIGFTTEGRGFTSEGISTSNNSIAIQDDGKIVAGGRYGKYPNRNFWLIRYNNDGLLDATFGESGTQITEVSAGTDEIQSIAIANNRLYAVGYGYGSFSGNIGIAARYLLGNENKEPTVSLSTPFAKYSAPANIKLNAKATDTDGTISKVEFYNGTTLLHTETVIPYGYLWKNVPVGNYTLTAKAYDNSGNVTTSDAIKVSVVNENVPPAVSIVNPNNNKIFGAHASSLLIAKAKDPNDAISKVEFYSNGALIRTEKHYPYFYWWDNLQPGTYIITAVATDAKGLSSTSQAIHITVEPNEAPIVNIVTPANHQTFTGPAGIKLKAAAKDADGTIHKVEFYNGKTLLHTETLAPYGYLWKDVPAGTYTITAKAFDNRGALATSAPITVTVTSQGATIVSNRPSAKESKTGENSAISLKLYPNPAKNVLSINTTGLQQHKPSAISVISASGVVVKTMQASILNRVVQLDVSSLVSGVYTIKVMSGNKVLYKQFVKL